MQPDKDLSGVFSKGADLHEFMRSITQELTALEVLVGFPEDTTARKDNPAASQAITNAQLGYVHDNGAPERNLPARPFMRPGIARAEDKIVAVLVQAANAITTPGRAPGIAEKAMHRVGAIARDSIKNTIADGIAPPLANSTLREKARRGVPGAQQELDNRAQGMPPGIDLVKPLQDTGQLRNAVSYAIRPRNKRK